MNLYARAGRTFGGDDRRAASASAAPAADAPAADAPAHRVAHELSTRLGEAMRTRTTIGQAQGILTQRTPPAVPAAQ
jgi:hypothetical protein